MPIFVISDGRGVAPSSSLMGGEEGQEDEVEEEVGVEQQLSLLEQLPPELAEQVSTVYCIQ